MVSRGCLAKHGCTPEEWRKKLEHPGPPPLPLLGDKDAPPAEQKEDEKISALRVRIRSRVEAGRQYNLTNFRTYQALDMIWSSAFRQVSPTILLDIIKQSEGKSTEQIESSLKAIGLDSSSMFIDSATLDPKTGKPTKILNAPVFLSVTIPLVSAYLLIRRAKLFNDRNIKPFIKIESLINSEEDRMRCEVLTARIQTMVEQYGYLNSFNQVLFMFLLYGQVMQFTLEEWHYEQQLKYADEEDVRREKAKSELPENAPAEEYAEGEEPNPETNGETKKPLRVGDEMVYTVKEGLRYTHPHPARCYWDIAHPMWTLNTSTGCEYAGYWRVLKWKEIRNNPDFYNTKRVSFGTSPWWTNNVHFFNSVYNYCVMDWPTIPSAPEDSKDREAFMATNTLYNESQGEQAVVVTEHRERIIPKDCGLGDYEYPIWARFVVAGDGTIIYAAPCCYEPVTVFRDNGDDKKTQDASLGLKLIGFQDQVSNLLSQFIYTAKQNLANLTLIDQNVVEKSWIDKIKNMGEQFIRGLNIFAYDGKSLQKLLGGGNPGNAIQSHRFPQMDTNGIMLAVKMVIDLAERVLQFSSQEVAQASSHEQTKAEMDLIKDSTTNILRYTGFPVDDGMAAQARQIYEALMAYGDDDFYAAIPHDTKLTQEDLEKMGITYVAEPRKGAKKAFVRVKRTALMLWAFAHAPAPYDRKDNIESARLMSDLIRDWFMNNQVGLAALGPDQLVDIANNVAKLAGIPFDRPLRNASMTTEEQNRAAQQQLQTMMEQAAVEQKKGMQVVLEALGKLQQEVSVIKPLVGIPTAPNDSASGPGGAAPGQGAVAPEMALPA